MASTPNDTVPFLTKMSSKKDLEGKCDRMTCSEYFQRCWLRLKRSFPEKEDWD